MELKDIQQMSVEEEQRLAHLMCDEEFENGVSVEESKERTSLIFLRQANDFKKLATDEHVNDKADKNYERLAIENYEAYLEYIK